MQVKHPSATSAFVQVVDVLGDHVYIELLLQSSDRMVGGIRSRSKDLCPALVVEVEYQRGVTGERFGCGHVLDPVLFPKPIAIAEGA